MTSWKILRFARHVSRTNANSHAAVAFLAASMRATLLYLDSSFHFIVALQSWRAQI